jgi:23S rRNA (guanosine2251-2'-O)-methyltransferase
MILEGKISVKAALLCGKREVNTVYVQKGRHDKETAFILAKAREKGIRTEVAEREKLDALAEGKTHGGILCDAMPKAKDEEALLFAGENPFVFVLEGAEDPYNLGYVIRALYSGGCTGLILRARSWEHAEPTILKSSAGASEYLPIVMSEDPSAVIRHAREHGIRAYAAMRKDASPIYEADFTVPVLIAIGGEMRGLSASVLDACDANIFIPYANDFRNALNAAGAAAVLGFEVNRQRNYAGSKLKQKEEF